MTTAPDPLDFARRLIEQGVPVFVAKPNSSKLGYKLPDGWQVTEASARCLDAWKPGDAVGAVMGQGVDLLDTDVKRDPDAGPRSRRQLVEAGLWPTIYAVAVTPSGGTHEFIASLGVNSHDAYRPGLDYKGGRPDGSGRGFAFIAPTPGYHLIPGDTLDELDPDDDSGAALAEAIRPSQAGKPDEPTAQHSGGSSDPWEQFETPGVPSIGTPITEARDTTLARYVASLANRGSRREEAWILAQARIGDVVGGDPKWPFTEKDFDRWWRGAQQFSPRDAADSALDDAGEPLTEHERAVEKEAERLFVLEDARRLVADRRAASEATGASRLVDGGRFVFDLPEGIPALWGAGQDVLWAQGEALIIAGPPGVGKTTLAHQVVASLIEGGEVLGLPVAPASSRILYLACDRPRQIARAMRRRLGDMDRADLAERLAVWEGPPPADFARDTQVLTRMAQDAGAGIVVVDSLKDVALGLSDDIVGAGLNMSRQRAIAEGIEVLELHHLVKRGENGSAPTKLTDLYGSAWITAGAGSVVLLWGEAGDLTVRLSHLKQPGATVGPLLVTHDHAAGRSSVQSSIRVEDLARMFVGGMTAKAGAAAATGNDKPTSAEIAVFTRRCDAAVRDGHLVKIPGARGRGPDNAAVWRPRCPDLDSAMVRCGLESNHESNHGPSVISSGPQITDAA